MRINKYFLLAIIIMLSWVTLLSSLAIESAKSGRNLILVALPFESVSRVAYELEKIYNIKAVGYETDLTSDENINSLAEWIKSNYKIDMLINNAGIGGTNHFGEAKTGYIDTIIQLNMKALVKSTFLSPDQVAQILIRKTLKRKTVVVPGFVNKISRLFIKFVPEEIRLNIFSKNLQKEIIVEAA